MKNITFKIALLGLTIAGAIHAADAVVSRLPRVAGFSQLEQFEHLPYPLNFIEAHKALTQAQRNTFLQRLPSEHVQQSVRETFRQCERQSQQPFPYNVLGLIEARVYEARRQQQGWPSYKRYPEFTDILQAHPDLASIPYPGPLTVNHGSEPQPAQAVLALRAVHMGMMGLFAQLIESGLDPRIRFDSPEDPRVHQKPLLRLDGDINTHRVFPVILDYVVQMNGTSKAQPFYHQLSQTIQNRIPGIGQNVADLIVEFTPTEAVSALQAYRENGKSLLDLKLEELARLDSPDQGYVQKVELKRIAHLIKAGIPTAKREDLLAEYLKRGTNSHRTVTIASACTVAIAVLAYWWSR